MATPRDQIRSHYNQLSNNTIAERTKSKIFYLRNFNNWVKSVLIGDTISELMYSLQTLSSDLRVLDLASGKGGDMFKWAKSQVGHVAFTDIASVSVEQSEERYKDLARRNRSIFSSEFFCADATKDRYQKSLKSPTKLFHLVSCQFALHYGFESERQARVLLANVTENLEMGGLFIGTTADAYHIVKRLRDSESDERAIDSDICRITFPTRPSSPEGKGESDGKEEEEDAAPFPLFGCKYRFELDAQVDAPEFLVYFPLLCRMMHEFGMQLVFAENFSDFFNRKISKHDNRALLKKMQGLEPYPPSEGTQLSQPESSYSHCSVKPPAAAVSHQSHDAAQRRPPSVSSVGTLSKEEWEVATIYMVYAFRKVREVAVPDSLFEKPRPPPPENSACSSTSTDGTGDASGTRTLHTENGDSSS